MKDFKRSWYMTSDLLSTRSKKRWILPGMVFGGGSPTTPTVEVTASNVAYMHSGRITVVSNEPRT